MKHRALIVEDDTDIAESVTDTLESLGHEHVWAQSQEEARPRIATGGFSYVLLDLQIPVRFGRGLPCIEFGEHLAREIHRSPAMQGVPIIVMTAYGKQGLEIAAPLCEHGVVDFINKPFPVTGRTLASVIRSALERTGRKRSGAAERLKPEKPFHGGELVFYADRVELCGVPVASHGKSCQLWTILLALSQRLDGRFKTMDGNALASLVGGDGGQGSIAGSIRDFRRNAAEQLGRELGLKLEREDVIETRKMGYRLNQRIVVKDLRVTGPHSVVTGPQSLVTGPLLLADTRVSASDGPADTGSGDPASERREQILALIGAGERLRVPGFAQKLSCSYTSAKREIDALKAEGCIEFVGAPKTGYYRRMGG